MTQSNRSPASMRLFTLMFMLPDSAFILIAAQMKARITPITAQPSAFPIDFFSFVKMNIMKLMLYKVFNAWNQIYFTV